MYRIGIAAALMVVSVSCVRQVRTVQAPAGSPTVWDRQIKNARDAGDGDYALKVLREKSAAEPDNLPVRLELARAYRQRGYPDVALEVCRLAAARFPASTDAELALVEALHAMNRRTDAVASLEAFVQAHPPASPEASSWLGILRDESGQWAAAEASHRQALDADPRRDTLHNNLGYNLLMQQKYEAAAAEFREAIDLNPGSTTARNNLGLALANLDQREQAVAAWQAASDAATAHSNMAAVLIEKAKYPEARQELDTALRFDRNNQAALQNMVLVARLDGHPATLAPIDKTAWGRFKNYMKKFLAGPPAPDEKPASASRPGEEP